jgi:predicted permease
VAVLWQRDSARNTPTVELALGEAETWRVAASSTVEELGVFSSVTWSVDLENGEGRTRVPYSGVSARFFAALGTQPAMGRTLTERDETGNRPRAAVISDALWRSRFGADPEVLGRIVRAHERNLSPDDDELDRLEIVGVMPPEFDFPKGARMWLPAAPLLRAAARGSTDPGDEGWNLSSFRVFYAVARLRPGTTTAQAAAGIAPALATVEAARWTGAATDVVVTPIDEYAVGPARDVLWLMLAGGCVLTLLACGSIGGLLMFRAARMDRSIAMRLALGASRGRLIRHALAESVLLSATAGVAAAAVAWTVIRALVAMAPLDVPRLESTHLGPAELLGLAVAAAVTGLGNALWVAGFILRVDPAPVLTSGTRSAMHPRERRLLRLMVGWQVAVAVVVLAAAALFLRSVAALDRTPIGFDATRLMAVDVTPSTGDLARADVFFPAVLARVRAMPGVASAAGVSRRPLMSPVGYDGIPVLRGQEGLGPDAPWRANPRANLEAVTPGYFQTMGTRLLAGRDFDERDRAGAPEAVIVSASAAARYWPGQDPVGQQLIVPSRRNPPPLDELRWMTVVGIVDDIRYRGLTDPRFDLYLPAAQSTMPLAHVMLRTSGDAGPTAAEIRNLARRIDTASHVGVAVSMREELARETAPWRFATQVLTAFGALAAGLTVTGLTGMVSLALSLRRRELGIRAALGAAPRRLGVHVMQDALHTICLGGLAGLVTALALGRLISGLLVDTEGHDPLAVTGALGAVMLASLAGCLWSARRAGALTAADALRDSP